MAHNYAEFVLIDKVVSSDGFFGAGVDIAAAVGSCGQGEATGALAAIEETFDVLRADLALDWLHLEGTARFEAFRALTIDQRDALLGFAVAQTLQPSLVIPDRDTLPNIRKVWIPDATYFRRLTKPALLDLLKTDLGMVDQADARQSAKKSELVAFLEALFAAPFATLTDDQLARVETWAPKAMHTSAPGTEIDSAVETTPAGTNLAA